jgi:OOP family OmpA-OmpF porin
MKKIFILLVLLVASKLNAQYNSYPKEWSIEFNVGFTKPFRTMTPGYQTSNPTLYHIDLGTRYTIAPGFGLKSDVGYDSFKNKPDTPEFDSKYIRFDIQGVIDLGYAFIIYDQPDPIGIYFHSGFGVSQLTSNVKTYNDKMINVIYGLTGTLKINKNIDLSGDISGLMHLKQGLTFDGRTESGTYGHFTGNMLTSTIGIIYTLRK